MNDNERLPERKVAFDKVAGLCSQFRLEGGEAGEAEAAERKTPGAKLQRRWSTSRPSVVERWNTQLDKKGHAHKDTEGEGEGEGEGESEGEEEAEAVRQAVRRARGRRAKEALMEEATRKAVEEERFLVRQPLEEATRKVVETQAEVRAVAAEAQAAGARAAVAEAEGRVDTAEAQAEARAMRAMAVEAQAAGTLARAAVAEAQRKTVEAKAEAQAEARAVAAEAQARAAEALARAAVAEAQLKTEAAKAETQAAEALARVAVAEAQARAAVAEARALTAEAEGRVGTLESQASRSGLTQHPFTSTVQLQQSGMVELGSQAGSAMSELAPRRLRFSVEGTEPDAAAPLAAAESDVERRAQEVARQERAIATARDANLLEPHEIAVRPTRDSPALPGTARGGEPVGWDGGGGKERTACAEGCHVKGAVACAWQAAEAKLSQSKQEVALTLKKELRAASASSRPGMLATETFEGTEAAPAPVDAEAEAEAEEVATEQAAALALEPATTAQNESVGAAAEEAAATEEAPAAEELALNAMTLVGRLRSRASDSHYGRTEPYTVLLVKRAASDKLGMVLTLRREGVLVQDLSESIVF